LGISSERNKTDLVQRIKEYPQYEGCRENGKMLGNLKITRENIESVASSYHSEASDRFDKDLQTLRELARKSTECAKNAPLKTGSYDEKLQEDPKTQPNKLAKKRKLHESDDTPVLLEEKLLLEFKKLENAMLNFDNKLNTVML
ncbi:7028_t:CDS:1, partial [Racocetra persica]